MTGPESTLAQTFAELTDTLVADFDVIDFLHRLTRRGQRVLGVDAVGLLLADHHGTLNVLAASSEQARVLELFQLQNAEGPCLDCYHTGIPVVCDDLAAATDRWPLFTQEAIGAGFAAVHALPMRLRDETVGGLNLFTTSPGALDEDALAVGQALADVATIALLHERASRERNVMIEQLQSALNSRLAIEQAKGVLAARAGIAVGTAFDLLERHAHDRNLRLLDVAHAVVSDDPVVTEIIAELSDTDRTGR
ncbi:MAG: ANTAR domain-containing protein [Actinophytocola sp.]|nr:ANTAR domain-containing protein [Actinophytocola sp.]